jgi:hypothetical protein
VLAFGIAALVNTIYNFSVLSLVGFALVLVAAWWVLAGCARRDEPLARWLLRVDAPST